MLEDNIIFDSNTSIKILKRVSFDFKTASLILINVRNYNFQDGCSKTNIKYSSTTKALEASILSTKYIHQDSEKIQMTLYEIKRNKSHL